MIVQIMRKKLRQLKYKKRRREKKKKEVVEKKKKKEEEKCTTKGPLLDLPEDNIELAYFT